MIMKTLPRDEVARRVPQREGDAKHSWERREVAHFCTFCLRPEGDDRLTFLFDFYSSYFDFGGTLVSPRCNSLLCSFVFCCNFQLNKLSFSRWFQLLHIITSNNEVFILIYATVINENIDFNIRKLHDFTTVLLKHF